MNDESETWNWIDIDDVRKNSCETISRLLYTASRNSENSTFSARNSLTRVARSAYTEWLIPLECFASTFLPLLSLPGTLSFGIGWRSTTSLTRCLMSAHLRASRQVDPHLYPPRCLDTDVDASLFACRQHANARRGMLMLEGIGSGNYFVPCEGRNNRWNISSKLIFIFTFLFISYLRFAKEILISLVQVFFFLTNNFSHSFRLFR